MTTPQASVMTTPQAEPVYIRDRNPQLVLEYKPDIPNQVTIENRESVPTQQWLVLDSGVAGYVHIQSIHNNNVITAGDALQDSLVVAPKRDGLDLNQLWILHEPDDKTNVHFEC